MNGNEKNIMEQVSKKIKVLGFLMTCFMVFYHCGKFDDSLAINSVDLFFNAILNRLFSGMGTVVMAWFFTISGFLLLKDLSYQNYLYKIKRRVFSLLIPYIVWQIIIAIKKTFI